jgi:hypothetical protein
VLCDLETYLCPHTVLCKEQAQRVALSSESQARVRSSPRRPLATSAAFNRSESGCPIKAQGSGYCDLEAPWRSLTQCMQHARAACCRVIPWLSSEAPGSSAPLPLSLEERLPIESHLAFEHVIDSASELLGQDGERLAFLMFFLQAGEVFLGCRMVSEEQDGGFRKGPFEMSVADFGA